MSDYKLINVQQLQQRIHQNEALTIVDIRDPDSFAKGSVPGALHLTNENLPDFIAAADMDQVLIVLCYHGNSSQSAAQYLSQQGFDLVYSLTGGYQAWNEANS